MRTYVRVDECASVPARVCEQVRVRIWAWRSCAWDGGDKRGRCALGAEDVRGPPGAGLCGTGGS